MSWGVRRVEEGLRSSSIVSHVILVMAGIWFCTIWFNWWVSMIPMLGEALRNGGTMLAVLCRIPDSIAMLHEEQKRLQDERDAFRKYARRVADLETSSFQKRFDPAARSRGSDNALMLQEQGEESASNSLAYVREIYRNTVMSLSHYEEDYDESLKTNMTAEFGPEIAETVATGKLLTPQVKTALVQSARQAEQERAGFLRLLEHERKNLTGTKQSLCRLHDNVDAIEKALHRRSARELIEDWKRLNGFEETCRDLLHKRQSQLRETIDNRTHMEVQEYLHQTTDWTYPVLNDGVDCVSRIQNVKRDVVIALSKWR